MLQFPKKYFEKEEKDGFVVSEIMKRVWAASLEVLQRVIDICEKYNLRYSVFWGTLLGAVRHKGFIPWDDDIDIVIVGEDYIKFLNAAKVELPEEYCVLNAYTTEEYDECFCRVTNGNSMYVSMKHMAEYYHCPFTVGVDVFPLYYLPRDEQCAEEQKLLLTIILEIREMLKRRSVMEKQGADGTEIQAYSEAIAKNILVFQKATGFRLEKGKNINSQLMILFDRICRLYTDQDSDYLTLFSSYVRDGFCVPKELVNDTVMMPFENIMVKGPRAYDKILKQSYGDYMIPIRGGGAHAYIYFKGQMNELLNEFCLPDIDYRWLETLGQNEDNFQTSWREKLYYTDETGQCKRKQVVLCSPTWLEMICNGGYSMDKLRNVLKTFEGLEDVLLWWFTYPLKDDGNMLIESMCPQLFADYKQIVDEYRQAGWGIYDDSCEAGRAAYFADIYFGDKGELCSCCEQAGKEIYIQNYEDVDRIECIR